MFSHVQFAVDGFQLAGAEVLIVKQDVYRFGGVDRLDRSPVNGLVAQLVAVKFQRVFFQRGNFTFQPFARGQFDPIPGGIDFNGGEGGAASCAITAEEATGVSAQVMVRASARRLSGRLIVTIRSLIKPVQRM